MSVDYTVYIGPYIVPSSSSKQKDIENILEVDRFYWANQGEQIPVLLPNFSNLQFASYEKYRGQSSAKPLLTSEMQACVERFMKFYEDDISNILRVDTDAKFEFGIVDYYS